MTPKWLRSLALGTVLAAPALLSGCASPGLDPVDDPDPLPIVVVAADTNGSAPATGVIRRAVCIGLTNTRTGDAPCPGCDVDAATVMRWVADRPTTLLLNSGASRAQIQAAIREATAGMRPDDLLTVSISGHGTRRPDANGEEPDGYDEGWVLWDGPWWDDDVWSFICTLPPCRLELFTDTCHAEGNWRALGRALTFGLTCKPRYVQMELDLGLHARAEWPGQIAQFAGSREQSYSYGDDDGGTWTQTLDANRAAGLSRTNWFACAASVMPANQAPAFSTYNASPSFIHGEALR